MINILVAETANKRVFYLTEPYGREELLAIKDREQFFCPSCGTSLILKAGDIKIPHFAHRSLSDCDSFSEPESPLHLQGKLLLHQFFKDKNFSVELEKYLPEIRQRADLLINQHTAIEFQCSSISAAEVSKRSKSYENIGIQPIWVGGLKEKPSEHIQILRIKAYQQEMFCINQNQKYLLSFNMEDRRFYYYSNLFYISGNRWIGKVKSLPMQKQSFPFAVPKRLSKEEFRSVCALFSQTRRSFIKSQFYAKNRYQNPVWLLCYKLGLDMTKLPGTIGVPFYGAGCIAENAVVWQLKAIHACRQNMSMRELVRSGELGLANSGCSQNAELLLENYLRFYKVQEEQLASHSDLLDILYDMYCKTL